MNCNFLQKYFLAKKFSIWKRAWKYFYLNRNFSILYSDKKEKTQCNDKWKSTKKLKEFYMANDGILLILFFEIFIWKQKVLWVKGTKNKKQIWSLFNFLKYFFFERNKCGSPTKDSWSTCCETDFHSSLTMSQYLKLWERYIFWYSNGIRTFIPFIANISHCIADYILIESIFGFEGENWET